MTSLLGEPTVAGVAFTVGALIVYMGAFLGAIILIDKDAERRFGSDAADQIVGLIVLLWLGVSLMLGASFVL
jgi:hypothetical protein